jgi:hypothetical protein
MAFNDGLITSALILVAVKKDLFVNPLNSGIMFCILFFITASSYSEDAKTGATEPASVTTPEAGKSNNARNILFPSVRPKENNLAPLVPVQKPLLLDLEQNLKQCDTPKLLKCLSIKKAVCHDLVTESVKQANSAAENIASGQTLSKEDLANTSTSKFMVYMSLKTQNKYLTCLLQLSSDA